LEIHCKSSDFILEINEENGSVEKMWNEIESKVTMKEQFRPTSYRFMPISMNIHVLPVAVLLLFLLSSYFVNAQQRNDLTGDWYIHYENSAIRFEKRQEDAWSYANEGMNISANGQVRHYNTRNHVTISWRWNVQSYEMHDSLVVFKISKNGGLDANNGEIVYECFQLLPISEDSFLLKHVE
jgi:hypothetical protein